MFNKNVKGHNMTEDTEGKRRVRTDFNPSKNELIDEIKEKTAYLIDLIVTKGKSHVDSSMAATRYEEGAMWAVKSVTKENR